MIILFFLLVLMIWSIAFTLHRKLDDIQEQLDDIRSTLNKDNFGIEQAKAKDTDQWNSQWQLVALPIPSQLMVWKKYTSPHHNANEQCETLLRGTSSIPNASTHSYSTLLSCTGKKNTTNAHAHAVATQ